LIRSIEIPHSQNIGITVFPHTFASLINSLPKKTAKKKSENLTFVARHVIL